MELNEAEVFRHCHSIVDRFAADDVSEVVRRRWYGEKTECSRNFSWMIVVLESVLSSDADYGQELTRGRRPRSRT